MEKLQIIILSLLPLCFGQFSIQGPSDGNRRAQGLKYSPDKGIEYTDQAASLGTGGFSITGASDGNSDFQIQGATDGNSEFRIQGATDGNSEFQIHGPTDGGSQAYIHNYEADQGQSQQSAHQGRAFEYKEPNGNRVNWKSYNRGASKHQQQDYDESAQRAVAQRRPAHRRAQTASVPRAQPQQQQAQAAPIANTAYFPIEKAPPSIQEILQYQAQIPYVNIIPEHLRVDQLSTAKAQAAKFAEEYPKQVLAQRPQQVIIEEAPRSPYRSRPRPAQQQQQQQQPERRRRQAGDYEQTVYAGYQVSADEGPETSSSYGYQQQLQQQQQEQAYAHRQYQQRRQAPQYQQQQQQQQQDERDAHAVYQARRQAAQYQPQQPQHLHQPQQAAYRHEPVPHYSTNVPQQIQEILRFQAQIPYDIVANQIQIRPEKPYVPEPLQHQQLENVSPVPAQYKPEPAFVKPPPPGEQNHAHNQALTHYAQQ